MGSEHTITRRELLRAMAFAGTGVAIASCAGPGASTLASPSAASQAPSVAP